MKAALAGLLGLLAFAAAPATASPSTALELDFHVPAQAEGRLSVHGAEWALLVFPPAQQALVDVGLPEGGQATTHSYLQPTLQGGPVKEEGQASYVGNSSMGLRPGARVTAAFPAEGWGSLFVLADAIEVHAGEAQAILGRAGAGSAAATQFPPGNVPHGTVQPGSARLPAASAAVGLSAEGGVEFRLQATGVRHLAWHNATVSCTASMDCPDGPAYRTFGLPLASGGRVEFRNYTVLATQGGQAVASGHAFLAAVGGGGIDVTVDGSLRLPLARLGCEASCAAPAEGTLRAEGALLLAGLEPHPGHGDRLRAQMGGTATNAMLDETQRPDLLQASVLAGGAALGIALLAKAIAAILVWRRRREAPKDHPRRQALQSLVTREPGLTFRQLQRRVGWGNGVVRHHLQHLLEAGAITACPYRNTVRYFENHGKYETGWEQVVLLRDPEQRWLHDWLAQRKGAGQVEVVRAAAARGWSRSTAQRRLNALVDAGLVHVEVQGRVRAYTALAAPVALLAHGTQAQARPQGTPVAG